MSDEAHVLICSLVDEQGEVITGSVQADSDCGHRVWIAPTGQAMIAAPGTWYVLCAACAEVSLVLAAIQGKDTEFHPPTPAQLAEIHGHRSRN